MIVWFEGWWMILLVSDWQWLVTGQYSKIKLCFYFFSSNKKKFFEDFWAHHTDSKILVQNSKFRIFTGGPGQCWHHLLAGNSPPHHDQLQSQLTLVTMLHHCSAQLVITAFYEAFSARGTLGQLFILQHQATIIFLTTHADSSGQIF